MGCRLFIGFLLLIASLTQAVRIEAQTGVIAGTVTDSASGLPVVAANVRAASGTRSAAAATGEDGRYRILGLEPGEYDVEVAKLGFAPKRESGVRVSPGGTATADFALLETVLELNRVVTTVSRGAVAAKVLDAPASISVVSSEVLERTPAPLVTEYLRNLPGVSIATGGLVEANIVVRGFNTAFSTNMLGLQDYRYNGLPTLRGNLPFLYTGTHEDIDRIEVLNGPAAAIYGPNSANGVLHIITKSPFQSRGTTLTVDGGSQSILRTAFRSAHLFGAREQWGAKISGEYFTGTDWPDADPNLPDVFPTTAPPERAGKPLERNPRNRRYNTEARLDYRSSGGALENTLTGGYTMILNGNEIAAAFGPTEARNWSYTSLQNRVRFKKFFAQVFYNANNSGNTNATDSEGSFILSTGIPLVDNSSVTAVQAQQAFEVRRVRLIAGLDFIASRPRSKGTLYGRYETDPSLGGTDIREQGAYLHGTIPLVEKLDLVAALRADQTNRLKGSQVSPSVSLHYQRNPTNSLRATFSRAFNSPIGFQYLIDQVSNPNQAPGFALRVIGNPSKVGWRFNRGCDAAINSGLCMRSPWVAGGSSAVASSAANAFPGFVSALPGIINALPTLTAAQKAALTGMLSDLNPILGPLRPTPSQIGTVLFLNAPVGAADVRDIEPLRASFNNTWELGYKALINRNARVSLDLWYQIRGDVGAKVALANPLVLFDPTTLAGYLTTSITQGLVARGQTQAAAQAGAASAVAALLPLMAALPQGSIALNGRLTPDQSLIVTYSNASGTYRVRGLDLAIDYQPESRWLLSWTYSFQNKIVFPEIGGVSNPLMSNTPKHRASAGARFTGSGGLGLDTHVRYSDAFPVNSGYYNSATPNLFNPSFKPLAPVRAQVHVDLGTSYRFERTGLTLGINATNILNHRVPNFAGTPAIGRLVLTRIKYDF